MGSYDVRTLYTLFQPLLFSPLGLPCIPTPRLLEIATTYFGGDTYGMLEAWKYIPWPIHCPQVGKQLDSK
jgi:hypothetical protein